MIPVNKREGGGADAWTPELALRLARNACTTSQLSPISFELLRFGTNAVFRLVDTPWVLRLRRPGVNPEAIERQVALARWLVEHHFPANRPAKDVPIVFEGLQGAIGSFWEWVDNDPAERIGLDAFGHLLRGFHELCNQYDATKTFPRWDVIGEILARLSSTQQGPSALAEADIERLEGWTRETASELMSLNWVLPNGPIHGDAHTGNVLATVRGGVLIDFDALALGPREWDLAPTAVSSLRFRGDVSRVAEFGSAYGVDLLQWEGWPTLRRLRELYMTTWLLTVAVSEERQAEVKHRVKCLDSPGNTDLWNAV